MLVEKGLTAGTKQSSCFLHGMVCCYGDATLYGLG